MTYKFIDLFAGIGGFHQAFEELGARCVFASEWDKHARLTYEFNFVGKSKGLLKKKYFVGDITKIDKVNEIPDFDILCAGFPCQPFSQAGHKRGFKDERGNLFFEIAEIIQAKIDKGNPPGAIFLENVQHLLRHDGGRTIKKIRKILTKDLQYKIFEFKVRASDHGLPQHRPRLFIIAMRDHNVEIIQPEPKELVFDMNDVWEADVGRKIGFTLRVGGRMSPIDDRRNWDGYLVNGQVERLTPEHGLKMQGFKSDFQFPPEVSEVQQMKQLGNSVAVWAIRDYGRLIIEALNETKRRSSVEIENE